MNWAEPLLHWLAVHTGTSNEASPYYAFWSGFGSDLGEVTLLAAIAGMYAKHNCHSKHCWRVGKHVVDGTPWCNRHHRAARAVVAAAQVSGGAGSNPATSEGLPADERVVPPPATPASRRFQRPGGDR
jgi:hypothetical protein